MHTRSTGIEQIIIDPTNMSENDNTMLYTLIQEQAAIGNGGENVIKPNHPYRMTIWDTSGESGLQREVEVILLAPLIKRPTAEDQHVQSYVVLAAAPVAVSYVSKDKIQSFKMAGTLIALDGQAFKYEPQKHAYWAGGDIDLSADMSVGFAELLKRIKAATGQTRFAKGKHSYEIQDSGRNLYIDLNFSHQYEIGGDIDLTSPLTHNQQQACARMLCDIYLTTGTNFFNKGKRVYQIENSSGIRYVELNFLHAVVHYNKRSGGMGFVAIGKQFAAGGFSKVYAELTRLVIRDNGHVELLPARYVVKKADVIHDAVAFAEFLQREYMEGKYRQREFDLSGKTPHLHLKKQIKVCSSPLDASYSVFSVERRMPGECLYDFMVAERDVCNETSKAIYTAKERILIIIELFYALWEQAHSRGVIHRDIKPDNIMIHVESGIVRLVDFGLAKQAGEQKCKENTGTLPYMPIEAIRNQFRDESTDIYSMAIVVAEFLGMLRSFTNPDGKLNVDACVAYAKSPTLRALFSTDELSSDPFSKAARGRLEVLLKKLISTKQGERGTTMEAIHALEKVRLECYLSRSSFAQYNYIKKAHDLAIKLRSQLHAITLADIGKPTTVADVIQYMAHITAAVNAIQRDTTEAIDIFVDSMGIAAFRGLQTGIGINTNIARIIDGFTKEMGELARMKSLAMDCLEDNDSPDKHHLAKEALSMIAFVGGKCVSAELTVDNIVALTATLADRREKLIAPLVAGLGRAESVAEQVAASTCRMKY